MSEHRHAGARRDRGRRRPARRGRRPVAGRAARCWSRSPRSSCCCSCRSTSRSSGSAPASRCFGAIVGAIGLNLLVGTTGQLSLAHAFFLAVGAVTYVLVSGEPGGIGHGPSTASGWPPVVGMIVRRRCSPASPGCCSARSPPGCAASTSASPRSAWSSSASTCSTRWTSVTGGFNGRAAPTFSLFGFSFGNTDPRPVRARACRSGRPERLWYLGLVLAPRPTVRPQPAAQPPRPGAADAARQRGRRRRSWASTSSATRPGSSSSARCTPACRGAVRAVHRQHRAGVLRARGVHPLPRHDRARRPRVGRRRGARRGCSSAPCRWSSSATPTSLPLRREPGPGRAGAPARPPASCSASRSSSSSSSSRPVSPASPTFRRGARPGGRPRPTPSAPSDPHHRPPHQHKGALHEARQAHAAPLALAAVLAAASGCSTKAPKTAAAPAAAARRAARSRPTSASRATTIKLGVLTDLTGVFAALGTDITNANTAVLGAAERATRSATTTTSSSTSRTPATCRSRACSSTAA